MITPAKYQARASNPKTSAWVGANAGSGKTHVLVQRMLRLLLAGVAPSSILCLTFTRAAAVEMSARLLERLGKWAVLEEGALTEELQELLGESPDAEQLRSSRMLFARVLDTPGELRIQTIHAFCERLLQRFPIEAKVPAQFRVLDEREALEMRLSARDTLLRSLEGGGGADGLAQAVRTICADITESEFTRLLEAIDKERRRLRDLLPTRKRVKEVAGKIVAALDLKDGETSASVEKRIFDMDASMRKNLLEAASMFQREKGVTAIANGEKLERFLSSDSIGPGLKDYMSVFFKADGDPRGSRMIPAALTKSRPDIAETMYAEQRRLMELRKRYVACRMAERSCAVLHLSHQIISNFEDGKHQLGALDFDDLIEKTAQLLQKSRQASWVLYKLDEGLSHVLIDEAQDTSPRQWEVISALADEFFAGKGSEKYQETAIPRSLFAVGDEKQSIFRFQGADLQVYDEKRRRFRKDAEDAQLRWDEVPLQTSFRSTPEVLQAVDFLFSEGVGKDSVSASGEKIKHEANRSNEHGLVELWDLECKGGESPKPDYWSVVNVMEDPAVEEPRVRLAKRIAKKIRSLLDGGTVLPRDILILVQRRDGFVEEIMRALKQEDVTVAGADRLHLVEHMAVMDLLALARTCLLREDDLSLAEVLKSPFFGLEDDDLFEIAHGRRGSLWQALCKKGDKKIVERLSKWRDKALHLSPFEFYHSVLVEGGREQLLRRLGPDAADPIDSFLELLSAYERESAPSLQGFLRWLERSEIEIKRDHDSARNEVRVMTVHGAKGLEAKVLFLPDSCRGVGHWSHDPALFFADEGEDNAPPLMWAPLQRDDVPVSREKRMQFRAEDIRENWRLLYVAMTRARDRLYICGHTARPNPPEDSWYERCCEALQPHMEEVEEDGETVWRLGKESAPSKREKPSAESESPSGMKDYTPIVPEKSIESVAPSIAFAPKRKRGEWREDGRRRWARRRGELLHEGLRRLSVLPPDDRKGASAGIVDAVARRLKVRIDSKQRAEILKTLKRVTASKECRFVLDSDGRNEVALSGYIHLPDKADEQRIPGRIDRLCFLEGGEVLAVEYKSDRRPPGKVEGIRAEYLGQVGIYYRLLQELWPGRKIRCGILWIATASYMEVPESKLQSVFNK
ncbi:MAG: double-strand break repair helicase AddA [Hyphomicrobiales bacterium]|nr:double-strand break repair helicase AddA [Hyphomicrobiales bacterium]